MLAAPDPDENHPPACDRLIAAASHRLHLAAAREAGAEVLYTLNLRDFQAVAKPGDPRVEMP